MPDRHRILHVVGSSEFGGDSVLVIELAKAARARGYEVDILATHSVFQDRIRDAGLGLVDLDVLQREIRPLRDLAAVRRLTGLLADSEYSLVHTHTSKAGIVGRLAAHRAGVPAIVHTVHGFAFHEESSAVGRSLYRAVERRAAGWCDRVVTVSEFHRAMALESRIGDGAKVVAIPNGLPAERVKPTRSRVEVRRELGVGEQLVALSTGRLAEQKGLEYLIRAVGLLPAEDRERVTVLLAGDGPQRLELDALISEVGVEGTVRVLGFRDDIADLLTAADFMVLPSLWEGLSISLLEGMAAGKPVLTTSIGSNREVTCDGQVAMLVPAKDPAALAASMSELIRDPDLRASLAAAAEAEVGRRYTVERMLDSYLALYDSLLGIDTAAPARTGSSV